MEDSYLLTLDPILCHFPDIHIYLTSLNPYTIVCCHACSGKAEFNIMGCSLFCHIVASYRRERGGWALKSAMCVIFVPFLERGEDIKSEYINV